MNQTAARSGRGSVVTVVIDEASGNFALVKDPFKPRPHYWKFPGGGIDPEDTDTSNPRDEMLAARNAAMREAKEETGLEVKDVLFIGAIHKKGHDLYIFAGVADFAGLAATGDEGEAVSTFTSDETKSMVDFFPNHHPVRDMVLEKIRA